MTLAVLMYGIGEYAAPPMAQLAKREKTTNKLADVSFAGSSSAWVKDGNLILRVQTGEVGRAFGGVSLFQLDGPTRLRSIQRAERISVADPGRWSLHNVATSHFGAGPHRQRDGEPDHHAFDRPIPSSWAWPPPIPNC